MAEKGTYPQQGGLYPPVGGAQYQQQPAVTVVQVGDQGGYVKWSWCNVVMAGISMFCCSCFGLVALIASLLAYVDHKVKDFQRCQNKQKIARGFAIAAIVIGSIVYIIFIIAYAAIIAAAANAVRRGDDSFNFGNYDGK